jgi:hypothetical protein
MRRIGVLMVTDENDPEGKAELFRFTKGLGARLIRAPESGLPSDRHPDRIECAGVLGAIKVWPGKDRARGKVGATANLESGDSMTLRSLRPLNCSTRMIFCGPHTILRQIPRAIGNG